MTYLIDELEQFEQECCVITRDELKDYGTSHFAGQKSDLNDAQTVSFFVQAEMLNFIRTKAKSVMTIKLCRWCVSN